MVSRKKKKVRIKMRNKKTRTWMIHRYMTNNKKIQIHNGYKDPYLTIGL
jgi:hypothetical protein